MKKCVTFFKDSTFEVMKEISTVRFQYHFTEKVKLDSKWNTALFPAEGRIISQGRIYYPIAGEGIGHLGKSVIRFRPGYIYLIPPFTNIMVSCENFLEKYWTHFNAFLPGSDVDIFNQISCPMELKVEEEDQLLYILNFRKLLEKQYSSFPTRVQPTGLDELHCRAALSQLLIPFLARASGNPALPDRDRNRIISILYYVEHNLSEKLTVEKIAEVFDLHYNYLCNYFSSAMGLPLGKYIKIRLIERAAAYLLNESLSIKEIAYLLGYDEVRSFSRAFKRACIYTPTEYRVKRSLSGLGIQKKGS